MDPRLLSLYNQELTHLREMGAEFAREYPKVAARLGMAGLEVADPYVERLLEGFAFIAARINLKLDAEFPRFTQHLLEMVYPHYLAPTPSFGICEFVPNFGDGALTAGVPIPRGTALRTAIPRGEQTACEFRTAHDLTLWPIEIVDVRCFSFAPDLPLDRGATTEPVKGGLRIRLRCHGDARFDQLACDALTFHVAAQDEIAFRLHELVHGARLGVLLTDGKPQPRAVQRLGPEAIAEVGFADDESLVPYTRRSFQGYRLLHEYFAFPQRFLFFRVSGLRAGLAQIDGGECELVLLFNRAEPALEAVVDVQSLVLNATPVANLFPRRADRIHLTESRSEHQVIVDRSRPMDFEVHTVTSVRGLGLDREQDVPFQPFYGGFDGEPGGEAYYTVRREPRMLSAGQRLNGPRTSHVGSELYLSLVDSHEAPYPVSLQQVAVEVLATNRDLPMLLPIGSLVTLTPVDTLPVSGVRLRRGPTRPRSGFADGDFAWRLVNHLSLNYLSLVDAPNGQGASALRELLSLYVDPADPVARRMVESVRTVSSRPAVRRLPMKGPIVFGRGLAIEIGIDDSGFAGHGGYLFGAVMEKFLGRYVSMNTFTETMLRSDARGVFASWPARQGSRIIG
jgi:type VI secretion system protein ImpG